jgi:Zn-dependent M28 family amino/carboxypeptidase
VAYIIFPPGRIAIADQPGENVGDGPQTVRPLSRVTIADAPMVYVGYGVAAPERDWDDFKGFDLHGKVAVFLVNDPDFEANPGEPVAGKFGGRAMTYYGRWTYKFEEAARRGAVAALVIHESAGAGYDWNVASNTAGGSYDIVRSADQAQPLLMQAWIAREAAVTLFTKAGLDFEALKQKARDPNFRPVELGDARFSIEMPVKTERVQSRNVLAKLPGPTGEFPAMARVATLLRVQGDPRQERLRAGASINVSNVPAETSRDSIDHIYHYFSCTCDIFEN